MSALCAEENSELGADRKINTIAAVIFLAASILLLLINSYGLATVDGVYHRVKKGETVWLISQVYNIDMDTIRKANRLPSSMRIRTGQKLFIPGADKTIKIEPQDAQIKYIVRCGTSDRWEYIVIHHSETAEGNARVFDKYHRTKKHFRYGLGYHFVICNGTYRRKDGQIEVGSRWRNQMDGAHCKAGNGNRIGIGICLVGDFNKSRATRKQFESLVRVVSHLCYNYGIPLENVKGHKEMSGAKTDCPGKYFPWEKLRKALRERGCT